jgi:outer membrane protein assembly factor BamB
MVKRRAVLAGVMAGLVCGAVGVVAQVQPLSSIRRRWPTGNTGLAPPARADALVLYAGDKTIGAISPQGQDAGWGRLHGLAGAAVFRPRAAAGRLICGGLQEVACWDIKGGVPCWRYRPRVQAGVPLMTAAHTYLGDGNEVVALDNQTGVPLWRFAGNADTLVSYAPAIAGDTLFVGSGDGRLYALSAGDGSPHWTLDLSGQWQYPRQLHLSGDVLVAGGYREKLYGISTTDGSVLWSFNAGNFINSHCVCGDTAYLWSPTGWVYAIDAATGTVRWRHRTTDYSDAAANWASVMAELVVEDRWLYALAMDDVLHVLDAKTGESRARLPLPEPVRPAVLPIPELGLVFATVQGDLILL